MTTSQDSFDPPGPVPPPGRKPDRSRTITASVTGAVVIGAIVGLYFITAGHGSAPVQGPPPGQDSPPVVASAALPAGVIAEFHRPVSLSPPVETPLFTTPSNWVLAWSYNCANAISGSGNFIVNETEPVVEINKLGARGHGTTAVTDDPGPQSVMVDSDCAWNLTVRR